MPSQTGAPVCRLCRVAHRLGTPHAVTAPAPRRAVASRIRFVDPVPGAPEVYPPYSEDTYVTGFLHLPAPAFLPATPAILAQIPRGKVKVHSQLAPAVPGVVVHVTKPPANVTKPVTKPKGGRPRTSDRVLTSAERVAKFRAKQVSQ